MLMPCSSTLVWIVGKLPPKGKGVAVTCSEESWMNRNMPRSLGLKLWSTRINSSRQFDGSAGEALNNSFPGVPAFGSGIIGSKNWAFRSTGTWLLLKCAPVMGSAIGQSTEEPVTGLGQRSEKLPVRSAKDGTGTLKVCPGTRSIRHSCDQKK